MKFNTYQKTLAKIRKHNGFSADAIHQFVQSFSYAESWYSHLSNDRNSTFFFYLLPPTNNSENTLIIKYLWSNSLTKSWDEEFTNEEERDEAMLQNIMAEYSIPREILEFGKIKLSRFIHRSYSDVSVNFIESPERKSFAQLHQEEFMFLEKHLIGLNDFVFQLSLFQRER
jgi:hypothetical protein